MDKQYTAIRSSVIGIPLLLSLAAPVFSQQATPGPPPIDRTMNAERARQQDMSSREWQLRNFGKEAGGPKDRRQIEALMAQTEEDFNRILTLHNEFARSISSGKDLNYQFISDSAGEIRKRASRLQSTLVLREPSSEAQVAEKSEGLNDSQIKDALIKLCKQIRSFVTNPVIETPNTVNAEQLVRARKDLESVIQLSAQIKKNADKLSKSRK
jgi:hypothetical protein